ncbi:RNA-binding protein [Kouleothrix aurantiaca]|jgi:RNA recognition motif-containing protein|uniref:RNA-binding protein n=1 Tax=Kouleothrix aurantiaca TaxID=186479 RepID=A0A0P9HJ13_9CHLR|nr:RNA-binding protein [Kouleothrix aurantiaca]
MNLYIGNLAHETTEADLQEAFAAFGNVASATIIKDRLTGESRGFGFVEMPDSTEAQAAVNGLAGKDMRGQSLMVSEARKRSDERPSSGGGNERNRRFF